MSPLRLGITPVAAPRQTGRDAWNPAPRVLRYRAFRDELRLLAAQAGYQPGAVLHLTFYLPMPASWSQRKRRQMDGQPHQQKPDIDNMCKAFMDALLTDDAHIWDMHARKYWAVAGAIDIEETPA